MNFILSLFLFVQPMAVANEDFKPLDHTTLNLVSAIKKNDVEKVKKIFEERKFLSIKDFWKPSSKRAQDQLFANMDASFFTIKEAFQMQEKAIQNKNEENIKTNEEIIKLLSHSILKAHHSKTWTLLHEATKRGDLLMVKQLANNGWNPVAKDHNGKRPIDIATNNVIKKVLQRALDAKLYQAVRKKNDLLEVKKLIDHGANVNAIFYKHSIVHFAILNGNDMIVEYLIHIGADIKNQLPPSTTFVNIAIYSNNINPRTLDLLLKNGSPTKHPKISKDRTPLEAIELQKSLLFRDHLKTSKASTTSKASKVSTTSKTSKTSNHKTYEKQLEKTLQKYQEMTVILEKHFPSSKSDGKIKKSCKGLFTKTQ